MAVTPINNQSTLRLMGMSSGMDTEAIIKQSLKYRQLAIDSKFRARTRLEWKQQALNGVKDDLNGFRRSFLTVLGANAMRLSSVYNSTVATVTGKNAGAVTVATTINSSVGTLKIGQIESMAKATSVSSTNTVSRNGQGFKLTDKLGAIMLSNREIKFNSSGEARVNINGTDITLKNTDTIDDINTKIGAQGGNQIVFNQTDNSSGTPRAMARVQINGKSSYLYEDEAYESDLTTPKSGFMDTFVERANVAGYDNDGKPIPTFGGMGFDTNGKAAFTIRHGAISATFEIDKNMTIEEMLNMVNKSGIGVTMKYDRMSDRFSIESNRTGANDITVGGLQAFGIYSGTYNNGSTARVFINGEWFESNTNTFDYKGLKISLNNTTDDDGEEILVSLKRDATEPINKIKAFIEAYNSLVKKLEDMLKERKTESERSYGPLTDEEKSLMTEKQVEEWEKIAKKALLRNDSGIQSLMYSLRGALYDQVKAAGISPSQLGLSTGGYFDGMGSQIVLDEDKLRKALEDDPEKVMNLFMGGAEADYQGNKGLLWRMEDLMNGYMNGSQYNSINNLENSIRKANQQIDTLRKKMYDEENRLYRKFAAMETALSKIQAQTEWMLSMLTAQMTANTNNNSNKKH